jgi:hypothetical protein
MGKLDRVLVKDRVESKPRQASGPSLSDAGWIVSLSKIALRANHDCCYFLPVTSMLDRVLVKDRVESKPRRCAAECHAARRWIVSLSKIASKPPKGLRFGPCDFTSAYSVGHHPPPLPPPPVHSRAPAIGSPTRCCFQVHPRWCGSRPRAGRWRLGCWAGNGDRMDSGSSYRELAHVGWITKKTA